MTTHTDEDTIPFLAVGNGELDDHGSVGTSIHCSHCGKEHPIEYGEEILPDGTRVPSKSLAFYKCAKTEKTYLAGINGKLLK